MVLDRFVTFTAALDDEALVAVQNKRLVLNVNFETAKDYDITSAYAVRGWNTTEGHMRITCPTSSINTMFFGLDSLARA
mgnify:CR=1 FL=1